MAQIPNRNSQSSFAALLGVQAHLSNPPLQSMSQEPFHKSHSRRNSQLQKRYLRPCRLAPSSCPASCAKLALTCYLAFSLHLRLSLRRPLPFNLWASDRTHVTSTFWLRQQSGASESLLVIAVFAATYTSICVTLVSCLVDMKRGASTTACN